MLPPFTCTRRLPVHWPSLLVCLLFALGSSSTVLGASLERLVSPGDLSSLHANLEDSCGSCHDPLGEQDQLTLCVACHEEVGADVAAGTGLHGRLSLAPDAQCQSCHREHLGRDAHTLAFDWQLFDHAQTDFPLQWSHGDLECAACHSQDAPQRFTPTTCVGCHRKDDPHAGGLGDDCAACHTQRNWTEQPQFDHSVFGFRLDGAHSVPNCAACHANNRFDTAVSTCVSCHAEQDVHKGTLGPDCGSCHGTQTFAVRAFDHLAVSSFALTAGHAGLTCAQCHRSTDAQPLDASCASCHRKDDVHEGRNGSRCESCHDTQSWSGHTFDHAATGFALVGAHASAACAACHTQGVEATLPTECAGCHTDDPHAGQLGNACESCHNPVLWSQDVAFHHEFSRFPLIGAHMGLACVDCHASLRFHDAATECASCHAKDDVHDATLGTNCVQCHNPQDWKVARFDHARIADFELTGVHAELTCASCHDHPSLLAVTSATDCVGCHRQDDVHEARFGTGCATCHNTFSFDEVEGYGR